MESLLISIIKQIHEAMPELMTIDEDYGQLEALDQEDHDNYPLTFPAVLLDASTVDWSQLEGKNQKGEATVVARLLLDCYDDSHYGSGTIGKIMGRMEMVTALHRALQGFRPLDDGVMVRQQSKFYTYNHGIKVYELTYTLPVTELIPETTTAPRPSVSISPLPDSE